eukprot:TRINITY_DN1069_c0_g1_i2.p1 TRINITY_DN1069_c0_g1~~TRINITY_DN1069_c0_g1_i2.p1  ORF type:complete len:115 (+),score=29.13 TRINITY_DN1069_c0_g1_i2:22-345(+)
MGCGVSKKATVSETNKVAVKSASERQEARDKVVAFASSPDVIVISKNDDAATETEEGTLKTEEDIVNIKNPTESDEVQTVTHNDSTQEDAPEDEGEPREEASITPVP